MIKAEIIADSINDYGNRITTFVLTFPRIVLAEFNTHRALSRNSASSRAIPFAKMLKMVQENPFIPIKWMKDHSGMQGTEYFVEDPENDEPSTEYFEKQWLSARDRAVNIAQILSEDGLTKQLCNRLLEPFMWHTCICTGTEWENFFALRAHDQAEIHIADLAQKMLDAYNSSEPKLLKAGEWHIPFGDNLAFANMEYQTETKIKIATARCARVSYLNFEGKDDYEADIKLCDRLLSSGHMSPFEHCAKAMDSYQYASHINGVGYWDDDGIELMGFDENQYGWSGNFRGFIQWRKMLPNENKKDERTRRVLAV